jgi:hypothetical protein
MAEGRSSWSVSAKAGSIVAEEIQTDEVDICENFWFAVCSAKEVELVTEREVLWWWSEKREQVNSTLHEERTSQRSEALEFQC